MILLGWPGRCAGIADRQVTCAISAQPHELREGLTGLGIPTLPIWASWNPRCMPGSSLLKQQTTLLSLPKPKGTYPSDGPSTLVVPTISAPTNPTLSPTNHMTSQAVSVSVTTAPFHL